MYRAMPLPSRAVSRNDLTSTCFWLTTPALTPTIFATAVACQKNTATDRVANSCHRNNTNCEWISNGICAAAAANCIAPNWAVLHLNFIPVKYPPPPQRCGLSSKFFDHLLFFVFVILVQLALVSVCGVMISFRGVHSMCRWYFRRSTSKLFHSPETILRYAVHLANLKNSIKRASLWHWPESTSYCVTNGDAAHTARWIFRLPFCQVVQTLKSRPNKAGLKFLSLHTYVRPYVRPSAHKKFLRFQWNL